MAEEKKGELRHFSVRKVENGYQISCQYEMEQTLSQKAGWVPTCCESTDYVEKTREGVLKRLKEVL